MIPAKDDGRYFDGVIAALGALCGMEAPESVHYHEVAKTFELDALVARARKTGSLRWSGIGRYRLYIQAQEREPRIAAHIARRKGHVAGDVSK